VTAVDELGLRDTRFRGARLVGRDEARVDHLASLIDQVLVAGIPEIAHQNIPRARTGDFIDECRGMVSPNPV
jgi:hypothetical protein